MLDDKVVLITGGTGSFGRCFVDTVLARYRPKKVIVFSRDELKQYEMRQVHDEPSMRYFIGDVRDGARLRQAMRGVDVVIHAAALKQVPAAEYNPMECIKTNVYGAENVIDAALHNEVERVVALSTDKAANPINLYGATKLASDKLFVAANNLAGGHRTRFSVVRYGNVAGSRGSVIPLFRKLIDDGATELPITHPDATRFWITLAEGVEFVLACLERMHGGEIFVPRIPSARVVDLAAAFRDGVGIRLVGVRPGEKIHEVMCPRDNAPQTLDFGTHFVIQPSINMVEAVDYSVSKTGERGVPVADSFEYSSDANPDFLSVAAMRELLATRWT